MYTFSPSMEKVITQLRKLPGIGPKMAQRIAFYMIKMKKEEIEEFAHSFLDFKEKMHNCSICYNFSEKNPCEICTDEKRDHRQICVVEEPSDIIPVERTRIYQGVYHVLMGAISPLDGVGPEELRIKELEERVQTGEVEEVILATNPNVEGEITATYISRLIKPLRVKVTRIAHGVPVGGDLEFADEVTLSKALEGRREF